MSAANEKNKKLSKSDRKLVRKQTKSRYLLMKHEGIQTSQVPTKFLYVANGGLVCEMNNELLLETFLAFGPVKRIIMVPDKPYSFVEYISVKSSIQAMAVINGSSLSESNDKLYSLYLSYITEVPDIQEPIFSSLPNGLTLLKNFVNEEEESQLIHCVNWEKQETQQSLKHRRVCHYGYKFCYNTNSVDKDNPLDCCIPKSCEAVIDRLFEENYIQHRVDQLTVNQYEPGQGIPPHIDTHSAFDDCIVALGLGSQVVMDFRHPDGKHVPVVLPRRSVLIMTGESRYQWNHGITPRKYDIVPVSDDPSDGITLSKRGLRTSFTFRKVCTTPCNCNYPDQCDLQRNDIELQKINSSVLDCNLSSSISYIGNKSQNEAYKLEKEHVYDVYDKIAPHFSETRHTPWPKVVSFLKELPSGSLLLDIGCGNGKYFGLNKELIELGCDRSFGLSEICHSRHFEVFTCDILHLPIRSCVFDACICIAVIHHLSTPDRRLSALQELTRIISPGGQALIYVWAFEQEIKSNKSNYLKDSKLQGKEKIKQLTDGEHLTNKSKNMYDKSTNSEKQAEFLFPIHINRTHFDYHDMLVPWHLQKSKANKEDDKLNINKGELSDVYHRFYHLFEEKELSDLCKELPNIEITHEYYDKGNWCILLKKMYN